MASGSHQLRIKYGLRNEPSDALVKRWVQVTRALTTQGFTLENAGAAAARQVFPDFRTVVYASEADTIETLLRLAEGKG